MSLTLKSTNLKTPLDEMSRGVSQVYQFPFTALLQQLQRPAHELRQCLAFQLA